MTRGGIAVAALAALALLVPQAALARDKGAVAPQAALPQQGTTIGFWAGEAVPGTDWDSPGTYWKRRDLHAYTPYLWRVLRQNQIPLYFNLRYRRDFGPVPPGKPHRRDGLKIIRKANRLGVPVWAWVLIPYSDGYWAWEGAAAEQFAATKALVGWARKKHVQLRGVALDPEPRVRTPFETAAAIVGGGSDAALSALFQQTIDPRRPVRGLARLRPHRAAGPNATTSRSRRRRRRGARRPRRRPPRPPGRDQVHPARTRPGTSSSSRPTAASSPTTRDTTPAPASSPPTCAPPASEFGSVGQISLGSAGRGPYRRFSRLAPRRPPGRDARRPRSADLLAGANPALIRRPARPAPPGSRRPASLRGTGGKQVDRAHLEREQAPRRDPPHRHRGGS